MILVLFQHRPPVKFTRIVARRFFKIDKTYTDANGNFQLSKRFPHKVTIIVKFRTSTVSVRRQPAWTSFWKGWYAIEKISVPTEETIFKT